MGNWLKDVEPKGVLSHPLGGVLLAQESPSEVLRDWIDTRRSKEGPRDRDSRSPGVP